MTISTLLANFKTLDTNKVINDSLVETKDDFERLNKEQLKSGKTNTGEKISPRYKSRKYASAKADMNPLPGLGVPDLFLTGEFYRQIDTEVGKEIIDIVSKDDKGPELENKYPDIFGLGSGYKNTYQGDFLGPVVRGKISTLVGLKFN